MSKISEQLQLFADPIPEFQNFRPDQNGLGGIYKILGLPSSRSSAMASGERFYLTGQPCKHGHVARRNMHGHCMHCNLLKVANEEYREKNRERRRLQLATPEGREDNRLRSRAARQKLHYKILSRGYSRKYAQSERGRAVIRDLGARRRAIELKAVPPWADKDGIRDFIKACPEGHHIDHIIPLRGSNVCGLHVLENLQYLDATENLRKNNKTDPLTLDANVCVLPHHRSYL